MGAPVNTGNQWILMPELAADDLPWLNQQMAVAGSHTWFLRELRPPRGPAGASRPCGRCHGGTSHLAAESCPTVLAERTVMESPPDFSWVSFDMVGP